MKRQREKLTYTWDDEELSQISGVQEEFLSN